MTGAVCRDRLAYTSREEVRVLQTKYAGRTSGHFVATRIAIKHRAVGHHVPTSIRDVLSDVSVHDASLDDTFAAIAASVLGESAAATDPKPKLTGTLNSAEAVV